MGGGTPNVVPVSKRRFRMVADCYGLTPGLRRQFLRGRDWRDAFIINPVAGQGIFGSGKKIRTYAKS